MTQPAAATESALTDEPADPYLWLEEVHGPRALAWAAEHTAATEVRFASMWRSDLEKRLRGILDDPRRLVVPSRRADWMYNFWRDADHPRGLWRRTPREPMRAGAPEWQVLLDVDALGAAEGVEWSFAGTVHGPAGSGRALVNLSPDGGDAHVVREFDLDAAAFVADTPFALDVHKSRAAWIDRDTLLVASALDGGGSTDSGYPISARVWRRGTPLREAPVIVEGVASDVGIFPSVDHTGGGAVAMVEVAHDFFHFENHVWDALDPAAVPRVVDLPKDAHVSTHGDLIAVRATTDAVIGGARVAGGTLLVGPLADVHAGRALTKVFEPTATRVLSTWTWTRNRLVLTVLDDVQSRLVALDPADGWAATPLELDVPDSDVYSIDVAARDADEDDELWVVARGFLTPATLIVTDASTKLSAGAARVVASAPATFDATGLAASQHWAVSADGTRVPYFEVGPRVRTGALPVLMSGYGGFEHALTPEYPAIVGPAWLEEGGVFVVANIRGGGEFGPAWHLAALRENRHRAYEDFVAVARDLVARDVSTADRIGCHGRSNGGLLVGNMLTQYPGDFGAIVCGVPLLDMRRYTRLSAGASWIAEYGDPDKPEDWEFVRTFSPYHLVEPDAAYPPSLIYAATSDDRVGPVQARKMAALLEAETDAEVHYLEPGDGGHAGSIDNATTAALHATLHAFLRETLAR